MLKYFFSLLLSLVFTSVIIAQNQKIDSLKKSIVTSKADTTIVNCYNSIGKEFEFINQDSSIHYLLKANALSLKINYQKGLGISYTYLGYLAEDVSAYDSAITCYTKACNIFVKIGDNSRAAEQNKLIGEAFKYKGNLKEALTYFQKALSIYEQIKSEEGIAGVNYSMGTMYKDMGRIDRAMACYQKSLEIYKGLNRTIDIANLTTAVGIIHDLNKNFAEAKKCYTEAEKLYLSKNYDNGLSNLYTWMAITAYNEKDLRKALEYFMKSHDIYKRLNNTGGLMYAYDNIGSVYTELGDYPKAIEWQTKSLNMALEVKGLDNIKYAYELLANTYAKKGDYKLAYENYLLFTKYKDSLLNESTSKQLAEMDKKFESAQKDKAIILKDAEILKQATIAEKQATQRNYLLLGIALLLLFSVYIYRGYKQKQKANEIIALQKEEVEMQKTLVEEKQKEILDSIHYAKRIQESLLPTEKYIERVLKKK